MSEGLPTQLPFWDWDKPDHPDLRTGLNNSSSSPYYQHRLRIRKIMEEKLLPFIDDWEEKGEFPRELHRDLYEAGLYGFGWPKEYGGQEPTPANAWQEFIMNDELARVGSGGLFASLFTMGIGLPPILAVGSDAMKRKIAPDVISGKKTICLAITEPNGGSDVASIQTTATLSKCKKYFIVNGAKTFISGGMKADYFTTGVKTTESGGHTGLSLLLIEKNFPGVKCTRLKTQG